MFEMMTLKKNESCRFHHPLLTIFLHFSPGREKLTKGVVRGPSRKINVGASH
jgi:hypothetical protein